MGDIMRGGKRAGAWRKTANVDLEELEKLCLLHCIDEELPAWFGVNVRTMQRRCQEEREPGERLGEVWDAAA